MDKTELPARQRGEVILENELDAHFENHRESMFRYAFGIVRDRHDAEDVVSETYFRAYKYLCKFNPKQGLLKTWVFRIMVNTTRSFVRRKKVMKILPLGMFGIERENAPDHPENAVVDPEHGRAMLENAYMKNELSRAISVLPGRQQEVFMLRVVENFSVRETGQMLGISEGAVKANLFKATCRLQKELRHVVQ